MSFRTAGSIFMGLRDSRDTRKSILRFNDKKKTKKPNETFAMFVLSKQVIPLDGAGDLSKLLYKIQASIIAISATVKHHSFSRPFRLASKTKKDENLTKICEEIFLNALSTSGATCIIGTFRCENEYYVQEKLRGEYVVTFVPLDGDVHISTSPLGSVFSIYRKSRPGKLMDLELMQPGRSIVACGYALYGPVTTLVVALAHGVGAHLFTLDPDTNEFIKSPKKVIVPKSGKTYSANEGQSVSFDKNIEKYFKLKKDVKKIHLTNECVFSGSVVADFHCILKNGGILLRPAYRDIPFGRFMLQFHVNPLAFIMIEAGGLASNGKKEITSMEVTKPRAHSPLYCGSVEDMSELIRFTSNMRNFKM